MTGRASVRVAGWVAAGTAATLILAPTLGSPFGPTDDYEFVQIHRQLATQSIPAVVAAWIAGDARVRPLYWGFRVTEAAVWGENAAGYHLDRLLFAWLTVALAAWIARRWLPLGAALLVALAVVIGPQAEGFYRLGPQEAIATPLALGSVVASLRGHPRAGVVLAILAALTKEPYAVFASLLLAVAWWKGGRRSVLAGAVALAGIAGWIAVGLHYLPDSPQGRYVLPWLLVPLAGAIVAFRRWPLAMRAVLACWLTAFGLAAVVGAAQWAEHDGAFAADVATIRAALTPGTALVVHPTTADYEAAFALRVYLPEGTAMLVDDGGSGPSAPVLAAASAKGGRGYAPLGSPEPQLTVTLTGGRALLDP